MHPEKVESPSARNFEVVNCSGLSISGEGGIVDGRDITNSLNIADRGIAIAVEILLPQTLPAQTTVGHDSSTHIVDRA